MIVDAHAHLWQPARRDDILVLTKEPSLDVDSLPDRLLPLLARNGIDAAVVIQSAPSIDHARFCLALVRAQPRLPAVMGWLDPLSENFARDLEEAAADSRFAGIRIMMNRMAEPSQVLEPRFVANLRLLAKRDLAIELLALPPHLVLAARLVDAVDGGRFILDHAGQPDLSAQDRGNWLEDLCWLAMRPNVVTKVSGLAERLGPDWTVDRLYPVVALLFANFGAERLMFATNWPVCDLVGGMKRWMDGLAIIVDRLGLSSEERGSFFAWTAIETYGSQRFEHIETSSRTTGPTAGERQA